MPRDLIVFGEDWGGLPSSTQHIVRYLSEDRKVIWVNSIGLRRPQITPHDLKRAWHKVTCTTKQNIPHNEQTNDAMPEHFRIINPKTIPVPKSPMERYLAAVLLQHQILPIMEEERITDPILWLSLPTAVDMIGKLNESRVVYYCGDDFNALNGVDHHIVKERENELVRKADLILAASDALRERFPEEKTHTLPHGVDFNLFSTPTERALDLPNDGRPIAGFYGSLSTWLDQELLLETMKILPEWHFVFIGTADVDISLISSQHNAHILGPKPHHELPRYSQHWNASLLPFKDNAQIRACNPLKLVEYLAAGKPVISTPFPAIQPFRGLVPAAPNAVAMAEALLSTLSIRELPKLPDILQDSVASNTWEQRAKQTDHWLNSL